MRSSGRVIVVKKDKVLEILKENLRKHQKAFDEALAGWQYQIVLALKRQADEIEETACELDLQAVYYSCKRPESHVKDYKRAIGMLEMDTNAKAELTEADYTTLVLDEWEWAQDWGLSNSKYMK